jgi:CelD/BcsL family acetyltransferase involved in cellulose biosynthesis
MGRDGKGTIHVEEILPPGQGERLRSREDDHEWERPQEAGRRMEVSVIETMEAFHALREEWNGLLHKSRSRCIFLQWEWLYNWWLSYGGEENRLHILVAREHGRTIGIAPLYLRRGGLKRFREIVFLGSNVVCSDYLDFILPEGREEEILSAMLGFLQETRDGWEVISLTDVPSTSGSIAFVEAFFGEGRVTVDEAYTECPYMELEDGWDAVSRGFSPSLRTGLGRKVRKFERLPEASFFQVEKREDLERYYDEFVRLNELRLGVKDLASPFSSREFRDFHRRILEAFLERGMARLCFLKVKDEVIAGIYLLVYGERVHYYQSGFDLKWGKLSPGNVLFYYSIRDALERGAREFDFLQGNEAYKDAWTRTKRFNAKVTVYNDTLKGRMAGFFSRGIRGARSLVRRMREGLSREE